MPAWHRFLTHLLRGLLQSLPLAVTARLLDTYDVLMLLCPLLELKPWVVDCPDGSQRRFNQGEWVRVSADDARKMHKCEAQARDGTDV